MSTKTISQKVVEASKTGREATFRYDGVDYEFTPEGLVQYLIKLGYVKPIPES